MFAGTGPAGADRLRAVRALTLLAVDPQLGGAVLVGPPGTGKGTAARAFHSMTGGDRPFVVASAADDDWDRWRGTLDWEATLREGRSVLQPGLWNRARSGTLFLTRGEAMGRPLAAWLARALEEPHAPVLLVSVDVEPGDGGAPGLDPLALRLAFWLPLGGAAGVDQREEVLHAALSPNPGSDATAASPGAAAPHATIAFPAAAPHLTGTPHITGAPRVTVAPDATDALPISQARTLLPRVQDDEGLLRDLLAESARRGWANPVVDRLLWRAARAHAALAGRERVSPDDAQAALELVVAPRGAPEHESRSEDALRAGGNAETPVPARRGGKNRFHGRGAAGERDRALGHAQGASAPPPRHTSSAAPAPSSAPEGTAAPVSHGAGPAGSGASRAEGRDRMPVPGLVRDPNPDLIHVYEAALQWRHHRLAGRLTRPPARSAAAGKPRRGTGFTPHGRVRGPLRSALPGQVGSAPGRAVSGPKPPGGTLALASTVMAALPHQPFRRPRPGLALALAPEDMRWRKPARRPGSLFIIAVDGSGSMGAARTRAAKGLALALLRRAYVQRAHVALLRVAGTEARVVLPPSRSGIRAQRALASIGTGGGSPLAAALAALEEVAVRHRRRYPEADVVGLLLTDGRANVPWRAHHGDAGGGGTASPAALHEELAALASRLRRRSISLVVLDRDGPGSPAADARALAQRLGCPFIAL